MTKRKMSDGERIAWTWWNGEMSPHDQEYREILTKQIDRLVRRRMAQAWDDGYGAMLDLQSIEANPYRAKRRGRA